ncbi:MAG: hypothetical protein WBX25_22720, partial [Rhodomicrobium sp.]
MLFGVLVGTYSSVFIAAPFLILIGVKRDWSGVEKAKKTQAGASAAKRPTAASGPAIARGNGLDKEETGGGEAVAVDAVAAPLAQVQPSRPAIAPASQKSSSSPTRTSPARSKSQTKQGRSKRR